ncbi:flavo protein monooxygenase [Coleophoma crateriformis]|uniref:Flavo protein monooxygenase n=1 Tax=Coleophoma crateriformis TaxID=565419 RepID=A0A3D8QBS7_9HELO|nr:flavo protein monooxygenase [Coleophoma crateriformis]
MSTPKLKVHIVGAGIAGPCLAYWLARTHLDVSITIIERSPSPRVTGQSIDIRGPAVEIVKMMKLQEAVRSRHTTEEGTSFIDSSGNAFAQFDAGDSFTAEYEILRADLSQLFLEATESLDNMKYIFGESVQSFQQTDRGGTVTFTRGSEESFDVVVAADGSTSKTRAMILDEPTLKDSYNFLGQYIAFFSIPSRPNDPKLWQWYNAPKGLSIIIRPHRNSATMGAYLCITTPARGQRDPLIEDAMENGPEDQKRVLRAYLGNAGWEAKRVLAGMDDAEDFYMSRAAQVKLPKWTHGRALVLGDAAFATFGIGTTLAIESAYILAGELSRIKSSSDVPQALERYEEVFRPLFVRSEELPPGFPQIAFPQTAWGLWLRDILLWLVSRSKVYKFFQGDSGISWKLPNYDWENV